MKRFIVATGLLLSSSLLAGVSDWWEAPIKQYEQQRLSQLHKVQSTSDIADFSTDGCSGFQSQSWQMLAEKFPEFKQHFGEGPPWEACCIEHDKEYWRGETHNGFELRLLADQALQQCVIDTGVQLTPELAKKYELDPATVEQAFSMTAAVMYRAVRLGGGPCSMLPWRWGYGWPNCAFVASSQKNTNFSDISNDESIVIFPTSAWFDREKNLWQIPVHLWVYEPESSKVRQSIVESVIKNKYALEVTKSSETYFNSRVNWLLADNEREKQLVIRMAGREFQLSKTRDNGHSETVISLPTELVSAFADNDTMIFYVILSPEDNREFFGTIKLVPEQGISIISDIDDTVKISAVTDRKALIENTLFKPFESAPGMANLYRQLERQGASFHFVSSSPWQLFEPLNQLMQSSQFPWATFHLKSVRFRDESLLDLFKKGTETKPLQIEPILKRYPNHQFILIGDSGEQDPEVYGDIARRYPKQVKAIWIRNITPDVKQMERFKKAFHSLPDELWQVFSKPEDINLES